MRRLRYVKSVLRTYPELPAIRVLDPADKQRFEAIDRAVDWTQGLPNGSQSLKIIALMYRREHPYTLRKAAKTVGYSYRRAAFVHRLFLYTVAANLDGEAMV